MKELKTTQKQQYAAFCETLADTPVFFFPWFLDGVEEDGVWDVVLVKEENNVIAAMPFFVKHKWSLQYVTMPLFTKFMGPLLHPAHRSIKSAHLLCEQLLEQVPKLAGIEQQLLPALSSWLPFHWAGFQQTTQYTYQIDLREDWSKEINRNMRRNIRKADEILTLKDDLGLDTFYRLNQYSFQRQGLKTPYSFSQLQRHDASLQKANARKIFFALDAQGNVHSAAYLIWDQHHAYYHLSGDDPKWRASGSGIWILNQAIEYSKNELGLSCFDFEGSMLKPVEAIRRQFGAKQIPYHRIWKTDSVIYAFLKWLKRQT